MNTRIQELAVQAGYKPIGTFADELIEIYNKKFAELIVRECAELCSDLDGGENMFSRGIRRHFGIDE